MTKGSNLQGGVGYQNVSQILPAGISTKPLYVPFPDFGGGSYQATYGASIYHGLQTKLEQQYANGMTFLLAYTYSKTLSDAGDLLNGGSTGGLRAYSVPGLGPKFDWARANFDIRHVFHLSGGYELPFGKGKKYMNTGGIANAVLGGWATNWIVTLQGGQPLNFALPHVGPLRDRAATTFSSRALIRISESRGRRSATIPCKAVLGRQSEGLRPALPARWHTGQHVPNPQFTSGLHTA